MIRQKVCMFVSSLFCSGRCVAFVRQVCSGRCVAFVRQLCSGRCVAFVRQVCSGRCVVLFGKFVRFLTQLCCEQMRLTIRTRKTRRSLPLRSWLQS